MSPTRRKRTLVGAVIGAVLASGAGATAFVVTREDDAGARVLAPAPTTTITTTTTRPPTTTTTLAPLPKPTPPPADPYADVPIIQIGTMQIPKIRLDHPIFEGVWLTVVDRGPGHWPGSAMPGKIGNSVFAGHRVTNTRPFFDFDLLAKGDRVIFNMPAAVYTYAISTVTIVDASALDITNPTRTPTITLFACHPKYSAEQRIVVKGKLVSTKLKAVKPVTPSNS